MAKVQTFKTKPAATPAKSKHAASCDNRAPLAALYETMVAIRAFEDAATVAHKAGDIVGPLHVSTGQEGIAAGVCLALGRSDRIVSTHRGHGHALAKGADPLGMMLELYGRAGGVCGGKGGSMHIADFSVGMLGANGIVAGGIPIAVGAAQGLKMQGSRDIAVCFFGDGAINRGPFLEGLNWAALYQLPVLFVCEDNGVAAFTAASSVTAGSGIVARATALGVPADSVDGNDAVAVFDATTRLAEVVRGGGGPRLLHAVSYRWSGHTVTDAASWRDAAEADAWKMRCPIARLRVALVEQGDDAVVDTLEQRARGTIAAARAAAEAAPWPSLDSAYEDV
jgi:acetoin:2,6-dichlorophenolindophenol oxidoreductase subunit alpha